MDFRVIPGQYSHFKLISEHVVAVFHIKVFYIIKKQEFEARIDESIPYVSKKNHI